MNDQTFFAKFYLFLLSLVKKIEEIPDRNNAKKNELLDLVNGISNNGCTCGNKFYGKTE